MPDETDPDDLDDLATRIETALERIAQRPANRQPAAGDDPRTAAIAERLDELIERLRAALGREAD